MSAAQKKKAPVVAATGALTKTITDDFTLTVVRDEPRADTRLLAQHLGILPRSVFRLVLDYRPDFEAFGKVRFENAPSPSGQPERFALLNEDQA